jgi:hypothetical protein
MEVFSAKQNKEPIIFLLILAQILMAAGEVLQIAELSGLMPM